MAAAEGVEVATEDRTLPGDGDDITMCEEQTEILASPSSLYWTNVVHA
jgi:hypothetical protein